MYRCRCVKCGREWEQDLSPFACPHCKCREVKNTTPTTKAPSRILKQRSDKKKTK